MGPWPRRSAALQIYLVLPGGAEVFEEGVSGVDADHAEAGIFQIEDDVDREGKGEDKQGHVEPAPPSGVGHLVACQYGGDQRKGPEQDEDNARRMKLSDGHAGGGDVDHGVEGGDQLDGGVSRAGFLGRFDGSGGKPAPTAADAKTSQEGRWLRFDVPFATEKRITPEVKFKFYLEG